MIIKVIYFERIFDDFFFAFQKSKKCYYAVLCERALELHESEKSQKKKRHAKHLLDLSTCFNIDRHVSGDFYGVYIVACDIRKRRPNRTDTTLVGP
uniref:Uncharacterized protein n=1 Tax=Parascaris equorum TaxID=6256 RepID=A0A914RDH7_PAREQ